MPIHAHDVSLRDCFYHKEFFLHNQQTMGANLAMAIEQVTSYSHESSQSSNFVAAGEWLDDADLAKKFEGKPEQLEAVKRNARTMFCQLRQVTLYEMLEYKSATEDSQKTTSKRSLVMKNETKLKALCSFIQQTHTVGAENFFP